MKKIFGIIFILAAALALRLYGLTSLPVFADEAIYVRWAQVMRAEETLRFLPLSDGKQPLYMWFVIPFLKLFSDPLYAGRFASVLCGLGTIAGVYLLGLHLFKSRKAALAAAFILAVSPFALFFDRLALVDAMLALFSVWTFYFVALTATTLRLDAAMLGGAALGGALLTKSPGLFLTILAPTSILLVSWPKDARKKVTVLLRFIFLLLVVVAIGYGMYNILRLGPNFHLLASRNLDYVYPYRHILESPLNPFLPHLKATFEYFKLLGPWTLVLLASVGALISFRKNWKKALLVIIWILVPLLAIVEFAQVYTARYILFILPFIALLAGGVFLEKKEMIKRIVTAVFIVYVLHSFYIDILLVSDVQKASLPRSERSGYLEQWTAGHGIKEVSEFAREEFRKEPDKKIVIGTEGYFGTLPDGLQMYLNDVPQITVIGIGLGIDRVPKPLVESKASGNKTFLLVNSTRLLTSAEKLGMELVAAYPKAVGPDGGRETLLLYKI